MCMVGRLHLHGYVNTYMAMLWLPFLGTHALLRWVCSAALISTDRCMVVYRNTDATHINIIIHMYINFTHVHAENT